MPKISKSRWIAIICFFLILAPALAFADIEYYTYGGFDPVSAAFKRCALLFSVNGYKTFVAAIGILGILIAGLNLVVNTAFQRPTTGLGIFAPVILGGVIYLGLFTPTENVNVYDPVLNQNTSIASVPVGVTKPAYIINMVERWVIDTLDNNPSALGEPRYQDVGVKGWDAAAASMTAVVSSSNASQSLTKYTQDCVVFEMARSGGTLAVEDLCCPATGKSYFDVLGEAANPAIYTISYVNATGVGIPGGESVDCSTAYTRVKNFYTNSGNSLKDITNACTSQGFADTAQCQTVVGNILSQLQPLTNGPADAGTAVALNVGAQVVMETMASAGTDNAASFAVLQAEADKGRKGGIVSGIVNPRMIDAYVAYALVLTPILLILVVSPLSYRVLGFVINLYMWVLFARVADVICYHNWAAEVLRTAPTLTCHNTGAAGNAGIEYALGALPWMQSHLGSLADMRSSSFLLATMITGALFKFTDSSVARLADRGDQGANQALAGAGGYAAGGFKASTAEASGMTAAKQALASSNEDWGNLAKGAAYNQAASAYSGLGKAEAGGNVQGALAAEQNNAKSEALRTNAANMVRSDQQNIGIGIERGAGQTELKQDGSREQTNNVNQSTLTTADGARIVKDSSSGKPLTNVSGTGINASVSTALNQARTASVGKTAAEVTSSANSLLDSIADSQAKSNVKSSTGEKGASYQVSQERATQQQNAFNASVQDAYNTDKSFRDSFDTSMGTGAFADATFSIKTAGNGVGGGYQINATTKDGKTYSFALSQKHGETLAKSYARTVTGTDKATKTNSMGYKDTDSTSFAQNNAKTLQYANTLMSAVSKNDQAVRMKQEAETKGVVGGVSAETAFVTDLANEKFNGDLPKAVNYIRENQQTNEGLMNLNQDINKWARKTAGLQGYGSVEKEVDQKIASTDQDLNGTAGKIIEGQTKLKNGYNNARQPTHDVTVENTRKAVDGKSVSTNIQPAVNPEKIKENINGTGKRIDKAHGSQSLEAAGVVYNKVGSKLEKLVTGKDGKYAEEPSAKDAANGREYSGIDGTFRMVSNGLNTATGLAKVPLAAADAAVNSEKYQQLYHQGGAGAVLDETRSIVAPTVEERFKDAQAAARTLAVSQGGSKGNVAAFVPGNKAGLNMPVSDTTGGSKAGNMLANAGNTPKFKGDGDNKPLKAED